MNGVLHFYNETFRQIVDNTKIVCKLNMELLQDSKTF